MKRILAISLTLVVLATLLLPTTQTAVHAQRRSTRNRQSRNLRGIDPRKIVAPSAFPPRRQRQPSRAGGGSVGSEPSALTAPFQRGTYYVRLDAYTIFNTRSRDEDTNYVSFALKVGDRTYPAQVKRMGDQDNGNYNPNMIFGPFNVETASTPVSFTYQIVNSGHGDTQGLFILGDGCRLP